MPSPSPPVTFCAKIIQHPEMDAGYIEFPFDTKEKFGTSGRVKVKVLFDQSVEYRGSLVKMGTQCHILGITREIRKKLSKTFGDTIDVEISCDQEVRTVIIDRDIQAVLDLNPQAARHFENLSYSHKKEYVEWINAAKRPETRVKRLNELTVRLTGQ